MNIPGRLSNDLTIGYQFPLSREERCELLMIMKMG
jgi:hypothetical protein